MQSSKVKLGGHIGLLQLCNVGRDSVGMASFALTFCLHVKGLTPAMDLNSQPACGWNLPHLML